MTLYLPLSDDLRIKARGRLREARVNVDRALDFHSGWPHSPVACEWVRCALDQLEDAEAVAQEFGVA